MMMRNLEPFAYFSNRASSIAGLGGEEASPDPNYCFHTIYESVRSGHALFRLRLHGARSSWGELNLRIHAWRPAAMTGEVTLVNSARLDLTDRSNELIDADVHFVALEGVFYAFYGMFTEASDLQVNSVEVLLVEPDISQNATAPLHQRTVDADGLSMSSKLCASESPNLLFPRSQPATVGQIVRKGVKGATQLSIEELNVWHEKFSLEVLKQTDMLRDDRFALLLNPPGSTLIQIVQSAHVHVEVDHLATRLPADFRHDEGAAAYDFLLAVETEETPQSHATGYSLPERMAPLLARGGIGLAFMAMPGDLGEVVWRNFLQQIALRLIGGGHEVMQLVFPEDAGWFPQPQHTGSFAFLFRK